MEKITTQTSNLTQENMRKIAEIFPDVITEVMDEEGKIRRAIDFDVLKDDLSDSIADGYRERYQFTWPGKAKAKLEARIPTTKTMRPCQEKSVDWDTTKNIYIEGDNLKALKIMREAYAGKVDTIYMDPPYNIGADAIYIDDYSLTFDEYVSESGEYDEEGGRLVANTEANGRFHSDWCSMIFPRLLIARDLLAPNGVLFISINDAEYGNLRSICDGILRYAGTIHCQMSTTQGMKVRAAQQGNIVKNAEFVVMYTRDGHKDIARNTPLYDLRPDYDEHYSLYLKDDGSIGKLSELYDYRFPNDLNNKKPLKLGEAYKKSAEFAEIVRSHLAEIVRSDKVPELITENDIKQGRWTEVIHNNRSYILTLDSNGKMRQLLRLKDSWGPTDGYYGEEGLRKIRGNWWDGFYIDMGNVSKEGDTVFKNGKKPIRLIKQLIKMSCPKDGLVLDIFSGSATTGHAVMSLNYEDGGSRQFLLVQYPEQIREGEFDTICNLGEERLRRSGGKIALDAAAVNSQLRLGEEPKDLPDLGFRVLRIDNSCMNDTYRLPSDYNQSTLDLYVDNLKYDSSSLDLLFEVLPKFRIPYSVQIKKESMEGCTVYNVNDGQLIACFDTRVSMETIEMIAKEKPLYAVFRDASFTNDSVVANLEELFKTFSPDTVRRVI